MTFCVSGTTCLCCNAAATGGPEVGRTQEAATTSILLPEPVAAVWHSSYSEFCLIMISFFHSWRLASAKFNSEINVFVYDHFQWKSFVWLLLLCVRLLVITIVVPVASLSYVLMHYFWGSCNFFFSAVYHNVWRAPRTSFVLREFWLPLFCEASYFFFKFILQNKYADKPHSTFLRVLTLAVWGFSAFKMFTNTLLQMLMSLEFVLLNKLHKLPWTHWLPAQLD